MRGITPWLFFLFSNTQKKNPEATANEIGNTLINRVDFVHSFNVIKGFLNVTIKDRIWIEELNTIAFDSNFGITPTSANSKHVVIEYSSPNTNKPLHLGHVRNNLIGHSISQILKANGKRVTQVNLINDRGIHICKTMLAWMKWGENKSPKDNNQKGDKFVGDLYVKFEMELQKEQNHIKDNHKNETEASESDSPLMIEARELLKKWEEKDPQTISIWSMMNKWVLDGFQKTYERMNISFHKYYFESDTYLLGKEIVVEKLNKGVFYKKEDSSVWIDLKDEGLDEKLLLRSDGTSVYITQDLGTAVTRHKDFQPDIMLYVVGNEQNYHFQVLKHILHKSGFHWADSIRHLSYGMVELPEGKMKSREGKVVDADDLMDEMYNTAHSISQLSGKATSLNNSDFEHVIEMIAQAALKYFILKVDAKKNMVFSPDESIDFNGNTGPFIQYTHARIISLLQKAKQLGFESKEIKHHTISEQEKKIITILHSYPNVVNESGAKLNPAIIAHFAYELAKEYNSFYQNYIIIKEQSTEKRTIRLNISQATANVLHSAFRLLGIEMPGIM
jgi:arginyl-tRNA synthetase